jgi:SpoVK/Ycf46/Vps4 family AAA+-type ATPase
MSHFSTARLRVRASVVRGAEVDGGAVSWDDIGGLGAVKKRLRQAVEWPVQHAAAFHRLGLTPPRGILLHGPPGSSRPLLCADRPGRNIRG